MVRSIYGYPVAKWIIGVLLGVAVCGVPGVTGAQVSWPMYQANAAHTGYIPVSFDPNDFTLDWEVTLSPDGQPVNPVAAVGGRVFATVRIYFENNQDDFFTLDATDGTILWSKDFGDVFSVNPPAYDAGQVYLQVGNSGSDTHLYTFDAAGGALINDGPHGAQWERYYAPTIVGGTTYVNGGTYGGMYAFDFSEVPSQVWFIGLNQYDEWTPAVDGVYAYAYTGTYDPKLSVVRCEDGVEEFSIPDPNFEWSGWSMDLAPVLGGQNDVLAIQDRRLISFDLGARDIRWEIDDGFGRAVYNVYSGQVSVAKGVVYASNNGNLEARDQSDGSFLWSWIPPVGYRVEGTIIITDAHALIVTVDNESIVTSEKGTAIHAIDLSTHLSVWSHLFPPVGTFLEAVHGDIAWSEGRLYFARDDGVLTALRLLNPYEQSSVVQFEATAYSVAENAGTATVTVQRTGSGDGTVGVTVTSENGTAVAGADYAAVNEVVSWADGDTADKTVQVTILNDSETEGLENLNLRLHSVTGPTTLGVQSRARLTIYDDEIDVLRFNAAGTDIGEAGGIVSVFIVRDGPAVDAVTVDYATANGTASAGSDYTSNSGTLSWNAGDTTSRTILLSILEDGIEEDDENFTLSLTSPTGSAITGSPSVFTVTVIDNDGPRLQFNASSYQADETGGTVDLTVNRTGSADGAVSVNWATGGGSATQGQDYLADSGTLNWGAGDASDKTITLSVLDDSHTEGGESFQVSLSNPVGDVRLGQPAVAAVSIVDDEAVESQVNTVVDFGQIRPRVAMQTTGEGVVVWESSIQDGSGWGVFGQRVDNDGDPVGSEFQVNVTTAGDQKDAAVAMTSDGGFVVVWQGDVSWNTGIFGRRYSNSGAPQGGEFVVNSSPSTTQTAPRVASDGGDRFMVVWEADDGSFTGVFARVFAADGSPLGDEFPVNTTTAGSQALPAVAGKPAGGFVVVWESYYQDGSLDGVISRLFASSGAAVNDEFLVNESVAWNQSIPGVAVVEDGSFLVVWEDDAGLDGAFGSIRGRWFDVSASPLGGGFQINSYSAGEQRQPSVAAVPDGRAVVVWESRTGQDGSGYGVYGRVMVKGGGFLSEELQLNTHTAGSQYLPSVACSEAGTFVAGWTSQLQDGSGDGIFGVVWPLPPPPLIFADGFESGDTSAW